MVDAGHDVSDAEPDVVDEAAPRRWSRRTGDRHREAAAFEHEHALHGRSAFDLCPGQMQVTRRHFEQAIKPDFERRGSLARDVPAPTDLAWIGARNTHDRPARAAGLAGGVQ